MARCFLCNVKLHGKGVMAEIRKGGSFRRKSPNKVRAMICLDCKDKPEVIRYRVSYVSPWICHEKSDGND